LPVSFTCLDPLNRVKNMRVEVWAGAPGPARPYTLQKPPALPQDGPRQSHTIQYQNFSGSLDVPMPALGPGEVCWVQPMITTKAGTTHWGNAYPMPASMIPIERRAANLQVSLTAQKDRTVTMKGTSTDTEIEGKNKFVDVVAVESTYLEVLAP